MSILPSFVAVSVVQYLDIIHQWLNARLYEQIVAQNSGNVLVGLKEKFDFGPLERDCQGFHHQSGPGASPHHTIGEYVRVLMVKYLYGWSLRQTEERLRHDLMVKWFVGYGVLDEVLDYSALNRFEQWVDEKRHRAFFDRVLEQIDRDFPQEAQGVQIGDTFAMQANAAQETLVKLIRHTSRLLLSEMEQGAPKHYTELVEQLDQRLLFGPADERPVYWLSKEQRQQQRENTGRGAWQLIQLVTPRLSELKQLAEPQRTRILLRIEDLSKILQDEYQLSLAADGTLEQITELDKDHKGEYRLCSATDPDATCRNHGGDQTVGYNVSLAVTPHTVIREIAAATGAEPDQAGVAGLIEQQRQHAGVCPTKLIYDQAAGSGRTRAEVARVSDQQTQLVARIPPSSVNGRFGPEVFHLNEASSLVCPQQQTTASHFRSSSRDGTIYEFSAKCCKDCPLWTQCRDPKARPTGPRRVFISDHQGEIRQAQAYNQTAAFKQDMCLRPLVERVIFMLTAYDGARRARARGLSRADFQAKMSAAGRNLRTWLKLWGR